MYAIKITPYGAVIEHTNSNVDLSDVKFVNGFDKNVRKHRIAITAKVKESGWESLARRRNGR